LIIRPENVLIYHITDVANLPGILAENGLHSDVAMVRRNPTVIGYTHIKERRMKQIRVACCGGRFVGEFVPFYFCPRSPMLYVINRGNTGRQPGCQQSIVHLVSTVGVGTGLSRPWAISDGNAGASYPSFFADIKALNGLDWTAIRATDWRGKTTQKMAEFLVADFFPWTGIHAVGCCNSAIANEVQNLLNHQSHRPAVSVETAWYY
jgi:hypothetical protein